MAAWQHGLIWPHGRPCWGLLPIIRSAEEAHKPYVGDHEQLDGLKAGGALPSKGSDAQSGQHHPCMVAAAALHAPACPRGLPLAPSPPPSHPTLCPCCRPAQTEYAAGSPVFVAKIAELEKAYGGLRRTRGDGNCFFRSWLFSYLEQLLMGGQEAEAEALRCVGGREPVWARVAVCVGGGGRARAWEPASSPC